MLCAALLCVIAFTVPALAAEQTVRYPISVEEYTEGGIPRIKKVYQLSLNEDPAIIPTEDFERFGYVYQLLDITQHNDEGVDVKDYTDTITQDSDTGELSVVLKQLDGQREITTEDGYTGLLVLDHTSIEIAVKGYNTSTRNLSACRTYPNLSDADLSLVPKTVDENGKTLSLNDVQWATEYQEDGSAHYTATASYTGTSTSRYATGYTVKANYVGRVSKTGCNMITYTAIFGGMEKPVEPEVIDQSEPTPEPMPEIAAEKTVEPEAPADAPSEHDSEAEQPAEQEKHSSAWLPLCMIAIGAACGAAWYFRKKHRGAKALILALALCVACAVPAHAEEYSYDGPDDYLFGTPTSMEEVHTEEESPNSDRSKSVALIPPGFGTPTSYLPGSGEYLTPNLVPGALSGGLVTQLGEINYPTVDAGATYTPSMEISYQSSAQTACTAVNSDLYYSGGYLATLKIPSLGVNVKVYEGTDSATLAKGAGHFTDTSIWAGNVCVAGHNRGANCYFGNIHNLNTGDKITLTTKLGTRTYAVTSVKKISETDNSDTAPTAENCITLFTCVRNQSEYRWCVTAKEIM